MKHGFHATFLLNVITELCKLIKMIFLYFQTVAKTAALDRLTDTSKYGGTHRNRFTADGKGRGKEGRTDSSPLKFRESGATRK